MEEAAIKSQEDYKKLAQWFSDHNVPYVLIRLRGYSLSNTDYKKAKQPLDRDWPNRKVSLTESEINTHILRRGWIGLVIPKGIVLVDIDDKDNYRHLQNRLRELPAQHIAIATPRGGQIFFRDIGRVAKQGVKMIAAGGVVVDYRLAGKGQVVLPTSNTDGRYIEHMDEDISDMPLFCVPVRQYDEGRDKDAVLPIPIHEGQRDDVLFRHISRLREWNGRYNLNLSNDEMAEVALQINGLLCEPPLEERTVTEKLRSALSYSKAPESIEVGEWQDPIPFDESLNLPDFPVDVLPDSISWLRDMITMVSEINQVDTGMTGSLALAALSTALAKKGVVDIISHREPLNLYLSPIADSGTRKTSTMNAFTKPLYEHEKVQQEVMAGVVAEAQSKAMINQAKLENLQRNAAKAADDGVRADLTKQAGELARLVAETPIIMLPTYIADDITPERTGVLMAENGERLAVISAEGGIFSIMAGRYSGSGRQGNIDIYLKAHAGDPWSTDRIGRGRAAMDSPALTMCLAVQPEIIREIGTNSEFRGRGLLARFLFSCCRNQAGYRNRQTKPYDDNILNGYGKRIKTLMDIPLGSHTIRFDREAQLLWDEFYDDVEKEMRPGGCLEYIRDWGSKLPGAVARIAGLLHFAENDLESFSKDIFVGIAGASCVIGGYYKDHALAAFGLMRQDRQIEAAKKILEFITTKRAETFQGRDVLNNKNCFKTMEDIAPGIKLLQDRGYIKVQSQNHEGAGRPKGPLYITNPIFLKNV